MQIVQVLIELVSHPEKFAGLIAVIIAVMVGLNMILMGAHKILGAIKDKTESKADDKAFEVIGKISSGAQKVIDFVSANSKHE